MKKHGQNEVGLELNAGDRCEITFLTNYDTFGTLARKYNQLVPADARIDEKPIEHFRDALAHGRSVTRDPGSPMKIVKFSRPDPVSNTVTVAFCEVITADVIKNAVNGVLGALVMVARQLEREFEGTVS